jgi:hypothetical protein
MMRYFFFFGGCGFSCFGVSSLTPFFLRIRSSFSKRVAIFIAPRTYAVETYGICKQELPRSKNAIDRDGLLDDVVILFRILLGEWPLHKDLANPTLLVEGSLLRAMADFVQLVAEFPIKSASISPTR